jgi:predicted permease
MLRDILLALRRLRRSPIFTLAAALTLALATAANVAVFSVVNALVLRPLPVKDADRLVVLATKARADRTLGGMSLLDLEDYRNAASAVLEDAAGYSAGFLGLAPDGQRAERVLVTWVTGNYFSLLGLEPVRGRLLDPDDTPRGPATPVVVLGYSAWQRRFNGDPAVVGRSVKINGRLATVVGITPAGFRGTFAFSDSELYLPLNWLGDAVFGDRGARGLHVLARLKSHVSMSQAQSAMDVAASRLAADNPASNEDLEVRVLSERLARPQEDQARSNAQGALLMLALVGLVMALAGTNVTSLFMAQAHGRRHELATRLSLGASRSQMLRQFVLEGLLVSTLGAALGIVLGNLGAHAIARLASLPGDLPVVFDFSLDWRVVTYGVLLALATGLAVSLVAGGQAVGAVRLSGLSSRGSRATPTSRRVRSAIVMVQIAVCFLVLVSAGLLLRSLQIAEGADLGFTPNRVFNLQMDVGQIGYEEPEGRAFFDDVERRVSALPGVDAASWAFTVPMGYVRIGERLEADDKGDVRDRLYAGQNFVGPRYFETMGIGIVRGRPFDARDREGTRSVAVVNRQLAAALWPGVDPIGRRFRTEGSNRWTEVVGLTETGKYQFLFEDPRPFFYLPIAQEYVAVRALHVRTSLAPEQLAPSIERLLRERAPDLALYDVQSMTRALGSGPGFFVVRMGAIIAAALGFVGLVLALVGIYGVVAQTTGERRHEMGIRLALGARSADILRLVFGAGGRLLMFGMSAGFLAALGTSEFLQPFLFGVSSLDALTLASVSVLLAGATLAASAVPAWQATRVDPIEALRAE